ncbi:flavodoxin [Pseudodesulfovibrio sp. F-1]|uniref:Flavodoxin n=1 Tax=Pseudodesulfovibrio alkaliphilus TaxID=2661613 RepID=A0A7K1KRM7_9BACT|nr:flavodoxin family protein [Pseudodesulfovibrio alkaliphilus]MUM78521.1 flavodoxin [Pseudodesulfovibrio alkaliphilus]
MSLLVVYSSRTGNTRKVAESALRALPENAVLASVEDAPSPEGFTAVAVGFWVDRGGPDAKALKYMEGLRNLKVGAFGTLGANPDSPHAAEVLRRTAEHLQGNHLLGMFLCQGRVDPAVVETMKRSAHHPMTQERQDNLREAERHPDDIDLENACAFFKAVYDSATAQA